MSGPGTLVVNGKQEYPYITVTRGMSGFFAVMIHWNKDMGGFCEPYQTGVGRYPDVEQAKEEARGWAEAEDLPYVDVT